MMKKILIPFLLLIPNPVMAYPEKQQPYPGMLPDNAGIANEWIQQMKQWEFEQQMKDPEFDINNALADYWNNGGDDTTEPEVVLQLPSDKD